MKRRHERIVQGRSVQHGKPRAALAALLCNAGGKQRSSYRALEPALEGQAAGH